MTSAHHDDPRTQLAALKPKLIGWLVDEAYPRWARHGTDPSGAFFESLGPDGLGIPEPRRARVQPRQVFAFAQAPALGWRGDAGGIVRRGIDYFIAHYRRADGLFRTLVDRGGAPLDERAVLYDQAFALLGFAAAAAALDARGEFEAHARDLRGAIERLMGAGDGAFYSDLERSDLRESNPHMHLLEACLAWAAIGSDPSWLDWVRSLAELAVSRFIRKDSGALGEQYSAAWQPVPGIAGRIIEPGHQFEWAWLLLRCEAILRLPLRTTALRLIAIGEQHGVHGGVAVNRLLDDMSVADADARFWPQTERLKAAVLAAGLTGEPRYWSMAHAAALSFFPYLATPVAGLWFDVRRPNGALIGAAAPASTFYHLVGGIAALDTALGRSE
jgi:mannose/cellobiose epimerase-like protein (N-acyl-D-glucosamine 2-epimerase family)